MLRAVLEHTPYPFALDLAALAARQQLVDIMPWATERAARQGLAFVQAAQHLIADKLAAGAVQGEATTPLLVRPRSG